MTPFTARSQFLMDNEEQIIEDQTKKKEPVKKKKRVPSYEAYNIKASIIEGIPNAILLTWDIKSGFTGDFIIGRSDVVPDSMERALAAKTVKVISSRVRGVHIDSNLKTGNYYYVILASSRAVKKDFDLAKDVNYTSKSIAIKEVKSPLKAKAITDIRARLIGDSVIIVSWEKLAEKGHTYTLYRSTSVLDSLMRLNKAEKIAKLSDEGQYIDQNITRGGTYYYAVTFQYLNGKEVRVLKPSQTYTTTGIYAKPLPKKVKEDPYRIINIRGNKTGSNVRISWDFSGKTGNRYMRLYRTKRALQNIQGVNSDNVIADVDITQSKYIDKSPPEGRWYYGIAPYREESRNFKVVPGINIIRRAIGIGKTRRSSVIVPERRIPDIDNLDPFKEESLFEKKESGTEKDELFEKEAPASGNIEQIIKKTFFREKYRDAIKELQAAVKASDNSKEKAMGRLFIGRSYIELGKYRKAATILVERGVTSHYPKEAAFWWKYAIKRLK